METDIEKHRLYSPGIDSTAALGDQNKIIWREVEYLILAVGRKNSVAFATTEPSNQELEFELARIIADSPHGLFNLTEFRLV